MSAQRRHDHDAMADRLLQASSVLAKALRRGPDPSSAVTTMQAARELQLTLEAVLQVAVDDARSTGHTWQEVGDALQTTRQAAFQRFGRPAEPTPAGLSDVDGRALTLFADLVAQRWTRVRRDFDATMRSRLSAEQLAAVWQHVVARSGEYQIMGPPSAHRRGDYTVVDVPLVFARETMKGRVSFNQNGQVAGLFILQSDVP